MGNENVYSVTRKLRNADVDMHRRLRPSVLLAMLQEAAIAHTEQLGMGRHMTLDRGLLWIITLQQLTVRRMPCYDETITVESWPGKTMHVFFPRYYRVTGEGGEVLVEGSALWTLMDEKTRSAVFPDEHGIVIPGVVTGRETPLPRPPRPLELTAETAFTVPYSYVDLNGHMNNVRYLDLAEDALPAELHERALRALQIEYCGEARLGAVLRLRWGSDGGIWYLAGEAEKRVFRMRLEYDPVDN
jgi:acyl-ACP thioesterase